MEKLIEKFGKYSFVIALLVNALAAVYKISFFTPNKYLPPMYLGVILLVVLWDLVLGRNTGFRVFRIVIIGLHLVFHGLVTISLPIGIVFALTGGYLLALQIFVTVYLPSILALFMSKVYLSSMLLSKTKKTDS